MPRIGHNLEFKSAVYNLIWNLIYIYNKTKINKQQAKRANKTNKERKRIVLDDSC